MALPPDPPQDWGRWGPTDEIGRVNLLDDASVLAAATTCIRSGKRFSLALPLGSGGGDPTFSGAQFSSHTMVRDEESYRSETCEPLPGGIKSATDRIEISCHGTTHMDALGHAYVGQQLWNGFPADSNVGGLRKASIEPIARRGVVGRAVLVDVAAYLGLDHLPMGARVTTTNLLAALSRQGTELRTGDVLILRTGALGTFYAEPPGGGTARYFDDFDEPGLSYEPELMNLMNEYDIVGLGTDTLCNEKYHCDELGVALPLHALLQRNLGITFHEALWLDDWASDCQEDGIWDAFYVATPLRVVGGTGGPMNPLVIK